MSKTYTDILKESYGLTNSLICMGLDPIIEFLPEQTGSLRKDLNTFFTSVFHEMKIREVFPGAFKPNIGYYSALDKPREGNFAGSESLSDILDLIDVLFPGIPVILDSKRGDIARSSLNYAFEAFDCWHVDAITVSPYMGTDSVSPFMVKEKGIYVLNRTSNPGGRDLQNLHTNGEELYLSVANTIISWANDHQGLGAVVGATNPDELEIIAARYKESGISIPLLIPGVGSQGGNASEVMKRLKNVSYDISLVRINSSSNITHPWKNNSVPDNWLEVVVDNLQKLNNEIAVNIQ